VSIRAFRAARVVAIHLALVGLLLPVVYRVAVELHGWEMTRQLAARAGPPNTAAWRPDDGPYFNPANLYWIIEYDCREVDVEITGVVPKARYWSLVPYDRHTLPLPSYLFDETVRTDARGAYTIRLTARPTGQSNEIDVSPAPRGAAFLRVGYPEDPESAARATPQVAAVPRLASSLESATRPPGNPIVFASFRHGARR
jgi:hypothetical protein